ncbi:MAG: methylated-DNA--[protein]-cysteine S-methyltransferase [Phycisphaerales bacterium]|nr:MAG: methylated-DNA--[protein]-cysteine S-methyltransferase [Phycisphaerales bacterium]
MARLCRHPDRRLHRDRRDAKARARARHRGVARGRRDAAASRRDLRGSALGQPDPSDRRPDDELAPARGARRNARATRPLGTDPHGGVGREAPAPAVTARTNAKPESRGALLYRSVDSPVGTLTLIGRPDGALRSVRFGGGVPLPPGSTQAAGELDEAADQIAEYFAGRRSTFDLPLDAGGTAFQRRVWAALAAIPFGQTRTYAEIAVQVGSPKGARAVGGANRANPLPLIVPCHRVVASGSTLGGYLWGLDIKSRLLRHEGLEVSKGRVAAPLF